MQLYTHISLSLYVYRQVGLPTFQHNKPGVLSGKKRELSALALKTIWNLPVQIRLANRSMKLKPRPVAFFSNQPSFLFVKPSKRCVC